MPTPPCRRLFRFSLRTLFIGVALIAVWLGYYVHWKSQRREARAWLEMQVNGGSIGYRPKPESAFPLMLKLLGERPTPLILMRFEPADDESRFSPITAEYLKLVKRVERLFPEAIVIDLTFKSDDEDEQTPQAPQP